MIRARILLFGSTAALIACVSLDSSFAAPKRQSHTRDPKLNRTAPLEPDVTMGRAEFRRLDPHGSREIKMNRATFLAHSECRACHTDSGSKVGLRSDVQTVCVSCHGSSPHSGAAEHLKHQLNCLSCHLPHRADSPAQWPEFSDEAKQFRPDVHRELPPELIVKSNSKPRLRKTCQECHR